VLPRFVEVVGREELPVAASRADGECVLELENARGDRVRVRARGLPDLTVLAAALWGEGSR